MELIERLAGQLGIDATQARALAGSIMGMVHQTARTADDGQAAAALEEAVPELEEWKREADTLVDASTQGAAAGLLGSLLGGGGAGGGAGGGGLGAMLSSALGGHHMAQLVGVFAKLGISPTKAQLVAPILSGFLESRLSPEMFEKVMALAPFLRGGGTSDPQGSAGTPDPQA